MNLAADLRFALRSLWRAKGLTLTVVLTLALGIGANTAIFTVINAVFLHPLAIDDPSRVAEAFTLDTKTVQTGNFNLTPTSLQNYEDYRDRNEVFGGLAAYFATGFQWTSKGATEPLPGMMTTANYFEVLGIRPALGRLFVPDEGMDKAVPVAVLSHGVWVNRFGSDRGVIGRTISLNGLPFTVIGVTPPGFKGTAALAGPERVWVPFKGVDTVVYDTHFLPEEYARFPHYGHSTPDQALEICAEAGVRRLVLYHHAPSHTDEQMDQIAASYLAKGAMVGVEVLTSFERGRSTAR